MRFLLAFALIFVSVFASAQVPMVLGGPQGIDVTRILARNWMSIPIYIDTPAAPLTGSGWPGKGYIIQVAKAGDTSVWQYTGQRWAKIAGASQETYTKLVTGGDVNQLGLSRQYTVSPSTYFINGVFYNLNTQQTVTSPVKTANANARIDVIALTTTGATVVQGTERPVPLKPSVGPNRLELAAIYYPAFDTVSREISEGGLTSVYRILGRDSIYFTSGDSVISVKDSIGISKNDTAAMLNPYKFTAANGLTKDSTVFRLGGSLNQNTNINLNTRRLTIIGGNDTTRFFSGGQVSIGGTPDSSYTLYANGNSNRIGNLQILRGGLAVNTGYGINAVDATSGMEFQGEGNTMFQFKHWAGDTIKTDLTNIDKGIMRIYGGFKNVNIPNLSGNVLWITPSYRFPSLQSGTKVRGIYYNPSLFSAPAGVAHIAYENTTGSNILNSTSGNTRIGYTTSDTTYKLDVNGRSRITSELTVGAQNRNSIHEPFANIFSDKEIISEDGFIVQSPSNLSRIKTGMDADLSTNILRLWAANANIVSMDYVGGGTNKSNLLINDNHNTGAGASGDVNTLTVSGSLANLGLNTTVHNQINIKPNITDSFGIGLFRGIFYNPNINLLGYDISLKHTAFQNTIGNNLLNSTSGNTRIGYNTSDTTYKLDVNGSARINGNGQKLIFTNDNGQVIIGGAGGETATGFGSVAIGFDSRITGIPGGTVAVGGLTRAQNKAIAIGYGSYSNSGIALGQYSMAENGELVVGGLENAGTTHFIKNVYFGSGKQRGRYSALVDSFLYYPGGGDTCTINGSGGNGTNQNGGGIIIAGGKGTGTGTPGYIGFSTSTTTGSGTTLQTLAERARINQNGRLLIGTTSDNGFLVNAAGGTTSNGLYARGYTPLKVDYVNEGNTIFNAGLSSDSSSVSIRAGSIGEFYRILRIFGARAGEEVMVNGTSGTNTNQDTTALFEITSTNAGFLQPRMTNVQRDSISSRPTTGLQIFSTTDSANYVYRGTGGGWQKIANEISGSATLDFPSTNNGNKSDLTINGITGAEEGDVVALGIPNSVNLNHSCFTAWVSAANTVTVRFSNYGTGALDPVSATFKVKVFK